MNHDLLKIPKLDGGLVTDVSPALLDPQEGYCRDVLNLDFSNFGTPQKRPGIEPVYPALPESPILGIYDFKSRIKDREHLVVVAGQKLFYWDKDAEEWTQVMASIGFDDEPVDMLSFWPAFKEPAEEVVIITKDGTIGPSTWDGDTGSLAGQSMEEAPDMRFLTYYMNRVVAAGDKATPYTLYLSTAGSYEQWDPDGAESNAVIAIVGADDGQRITGLLALGDGGVLIGKENSLYSLFGYTRKNMNVSLVDASVGVASHRSMIFARPYAYFVSDRGIYRYEAGGVPQRISRVVQDRFFEDVNCDRIDESAAAMFRRMYIVTLPSGEEDFVTWVYHTEREIWSIWDQPIIYSSARVRESPGEFYFAPPDSNQLYKLDPDVLYDLDTTNEKTAINAQLSTVIIGAHNTEVEKDYRDAYLTLDSTSEVSWLTIDARLNNGQYWLPVTRFETESGHDVVVRRIPLGATARMIQLQMMNNEIGQDLKPLSLSFVYRKKDVR